MPRCQENNVPYNSRTGTSRRNQTRLAERTGFEPAVGLPTHAFQACPLSRSGTSPLIRESSRRNKQPTAPTSRTNNSNDRRPRPPWRIISANSAERPHNRVYANGGEGGIRTRDPGYPRYRFSRPALSTTQPPLRKAMFLTNETNQRSQLFNFIARQTTANPTPFP